MYICSPSLNTCYVLYAIYKCKLVFKIVKQKFVKNTNERKIKASENMSKANYENCF